MKVFILESWDKFGKHGMDRIYSTKERAEKEKEKLKKDLKADDYTFNIRAWED